jgi:large subunit ribosomal protein L15
VVAKARLRVPAAASASASKVDVGALNEFENGARVDETALRSLGLANGAADGIKILGAGELTKKLTVVVSAISASAKTKIEAKGGTVEIVARKKSAATTKA